MNVNAKFENFPIDSVIVLKRMKLRLEGGSGHANTIYFVALFKTIEW